MLNACALEFVRNVDEMLFETLLGSGFQDLVRKFEPFNLGRPMEAADDETWRPTAFSDTRCVAVVTQLSLARG